MWVLILIISLQVMKAAKYARKRHVHFGIIAGLAISSCGAERKL
jgi:hypothetical protein